MRLWLIFAVAVVGAVVVAVLLVVSGDDASETYDFDELVLEQEGTAFYAETAMRAKVECPTSLSGPEGTRLKCVLLSGPRQAEPIRGTIHAVVGP